MIWAVIVAISSSWLFTEDHVLSADRPVQWGLLGLAWWLFHRSKGVPRRTGQATTGWLRFTPLPILVLAIVLCNSPYRPGLWLLFVGVALSSLPDRARPALTALRGLGGSACVVGALAVCQGALVAIYDSLTARHPEVPFFAELLTGAFQLIGFEATSFGNAVSVLTLRDNHMFPATWNHLAALPFLLIWASGLPFLFAKRGSESLSWRFCRFTLVLIAFAIARLALIGAGVVSKLLFVPYGTEGAPVEAFWMPWIIALTLVPLIPILNRTVRVSPGHLRAWSGRPLRPRPHRLAMVAAASVGVVVWLFFPDPGIAKGRRILIDDSRGVWERSDRPYTTDWYGAESGYNYACLAEHLGRYGTVDRHLKGEIDAKVLRSTDVLIVKTPSVPYSNAEVDAIFEFVRGGGGLFVLGEHTNVWGSSTYLNPILRRFGMAFRYDCIFDIERKWEQVHFPERTGRHPIEQRIPSYSYAVSCSVETRSLTARSVLRGKGLWRLPIDYAPNNFYPHVIDATGAWFGAFDQMVCATEGQGRVVAFTDSTTFSNFDLFDPGRSELLVGATEWLNRKNAWTWVPWFGLATFVLSAVGLLVSLLRAPVGLRDVIVIVVLSATTLWAGTRSMDLLGSLWYPEPSMSVPNPWIAFDTQRGDFELPNFAFTQRHRDTYEIFYLWAQRVSAAPMVADDYLAGLSKAAGMVILNPVRSFTSEEILATRRFLEAGGRVLILDRPREEKTSTANELAAEFGLLFEDPCTSSLAIERESLAVICDVKGGNPYYPSRGVRSVRGGEPLLFSEHGEVMAAWARVGRGSIVVAGISEVLANPGMGGSYSSAPSEEQRAVYELAFALLRGILHDDVKGSMRKLGDTFRMP